MNKKVHINEFGSELNEELFDENKQGISETPCYRSKRENSEFYDIQKDGKAQDIFGESGSTAIIEIETPETLLLKKEQRDDLEIDDRPDHTEHLENEQLFHCTCGGKGAFSLRSESSLPAESCKVCNIKTAVIDTFK